MLACPTQQLGVLRKLLLYLLAYVLSHLQLEVSRAGFPDWGQLARNVWLMVLKPELDWEILRQKVLLDWEDEILCRRVG